MQSPINLLVCGNGAWSAHIATTLRSALHATPTAPIRLLVGAVEINEPDRALIQSAVPANPITWIEVSIAELDSLPPRKASKFNFIELLALDRLPLDVEWVLSIDADAIVRDDLTALWNVDLDGRTLAATRCTWGLWIGRGIPYFAELGLDGNLKYLQSGVKVVDMTAWRRGTIGEKALAHLSQWHDVMRLGDQELLNAVIDDDWVELPLRWNAVHNPHIDHELTACGFTRADLHTSTVDPAIIHFAGPKPWNWARPNRDEIPWLAEWEEFAFSGPYRDWYAAERERGLAQRAAIRPQRRSVLRGFKNALDVLLRG
jgi:lipopolysaccharide biosynthesis glycosyltransferase